jgi:hypothetical protein
VIPEDRCCTVRSAVSPSSPFPASFSSPPLAPRSAGRAVPSSPKSRRPLGIKSVEQLRNEYDTQRYWAFWRDNLHGKWSSLGSGLSNIHETFDRHFMNYDWDAPNATR